MSDTRLGMEYALQWKQIRQFEKQRAEIQEELTRRNQTNPLDMVQTIIPVSKRTKQLLLNIRKNSLELVTMEDVILYLHHVFANLTDGKGV